MNTEPHKTSPLLVWWIIWLGICMGVIVIFAAVPPSGRAPELPILRYLPIGPLIMATAIRWFVLPRFKERGRALPIFIVGLAFAEGSGLMGMFLVPELRSTYFVLSLVGLAQFVPVFAARFES